jgi:phosphatidylglycerophosphatase A
VESSFDGGLGIMLDDVAAAVYALVVLKFIQTMVLGG